MVIISKAACKQVQTWQTIGFYESTLNSKQFTCLDHRIPCYGLKVIGLAKTVINLPFKQSQKNDKIVSGPILR